MSDQGLWFKLWCSALDDTKLDNLNIADFGRWAKLGAFIKKHGTDGSLKIQAPARTLCSMLQVPDFAAFHAAVSRLPNVNLRRAEMKQDDETTLVVSICNWAKYQGDFSTNRVRKFREMKRSRGEEKRREEKRPEEKDIILAPSVEGAGAERRSANGVKTNGKAPHLYSQNFELWWPNYPETNGSKKNAWDVWERKRKSGKLLAAEEMTIAVLYEIDHNEKWKSGYVQYAERWLRSERYIEVMGLCRREQLARNTQEHELVNHRHGPDPLDPSDPLAAD